MKNTKFKVGDKVLITSIDSFEDHPEKLGRMGEIIRIVEYESEIPYAVKFDFVSKFGTPISYFSEDCLTIPTKAANILFGSTDDQT